ncbi:MAG: heme-binding protein [Pseudomonadota bacterium]
MSISVAQTEFLLAAAQSAAAGIGVPMNIAILDDGANMKAFLRMDGALLGSADIAIGKAKTAALFGMPTEAIGDFCKPGGTSPGLENSNGGLVVFAGGIPVQARDGRLLGAIGVSGGSVEQDLFVAKAATNGFPAGT